MTNFILPNVNRIELAGEVINELQFKITPNSTRIVTWDVKFAVQKKGKAATGKIEINAFGKLADGIQNLKDVKPGVRCYVKGRLNHRSWQTRDGFIAHKVDIIAEAVAFEGGPLCMY